MTIVTTDLMMSLDGFIAGPNVRVADNPGGDGAEKIFGQLHNLASWRERQNLTGGEHNLDSALNRDWFDTTGAVVMGRTMYDTGEVPWGDDPPFRCPVFVLTHRHRDRIDKQGGTSFTFVTDGIDSALRQAKAAAGTRNVNIAGGADTVRQFIRAGQLDEMHLHVNAALVGRGLRLFDELGDDLPELETLHVLPGTHVAHLKYRLRKLSRRRNHVRLVRRHRRSAPTTPTVCFGNAFGSARAGRPKRRHHARSNRSRFMTLSHAATKSRTNFSRASSLA